MRIFLFSPSIFELNVFISMPGVLMLSITCACNDKKAINIARVNAIIFFIDVFIIVIFIVNFSLFALPFHCALNELGQYNPV
jgi:hypothetical protein